MPLSMTLHCLNLVRRTTFLVTQFMTNSQRSEWMYQSSALPVFLMWEGALMTKTGMSLVSIVNLLNPWGRIYSTAVQLYRVIQKEL